MEPNKTEILAAVRRAPPRGLKLGELATLMRLTGKAAHRLRRVVEELLEAGEVERAPGARYRLPGAGDVEGAAASAPVRTPAAAPAPVSARAAEAAKASPAPPAPGDRPRRGPVIGVIRVHPAGYGFVEREDGEVDVFVPAKYRGTALDGDKVRLTTWLGYKGLEGRVDEVVERGRAKLTGVVVASGHLAFVEPDDPRLAATWSRVQLEEVGSGARPGLCVVAEITRYPLRDGELPLARVVHVLGEPDDPRTEVAKIIACADIPDEFPEDTLAAARRTAQELRSSDFADRIDLRDRPFLTIDPETARDFDDAVCVEPRGSGFRVWVAVADVSHYVQVGSALDREARIRGCSVYLPDRAIPMLPRELSSGICSLNPEVDRCAMVVRIDVDAGGGLVPGATSFAAAVIRSHARLDYPGVAAALEGDFRGARARYQQWAPDLLRAHELAKKLRARRLERGSLDFDLPEASVVLDEDDPRRVRDVRRSKASAQVKQAYQLIEEYMLAANEAVARFFREREADTVWRVHDVPSLERLEQFAELARSFGIDFEPEQGHSPKALKTVLKQVAGQPYEKALNYLLLRAMKQATYDVVPIGHFGLASPDYLHFTSPIRRYPDLIVHRLLKWHLRQEGLPSGGALHAAPPSREQLLAMAVESSGHERRAAEAEREVVDMYRSFLMRDRVTEELDGMISGVTSFGVFVEIDTPYVEGMIKLDALGDEPFLFDDKRLTVTGRRSGRVVRLGDQVRVRVENVSVPRRRVDLSLLSGGTVDLGALAGVHEQRRGRGDRRHADARERDRREREGDRRKREQGGGRGGGGGGRGGGSGERNNRGKGGRRGRR